MDIVSLINKQLQGTASPEEIKQIQRWCAQSDEHAAEYEDLRILLAGAQDAAENEDSNPEFLQGFEQIRRKISEKKVEKKKIRRRNYSVLALIAVSLAIICLWLLTKKCSSQGREDLRFNSVPLTEVIEQIQQTYEVSIETDSTNIFACRFTGTFFGSHAAHEIVRSIAVGSNLKFEEVNSTRFKLTGTGCR